MSGAAGRPAGRRARSERSATVPGSSSLFAGALCAPAVPAPHCGPALHTPRLCARLSVSPALVYQPEHRRPGRPFQSQTLDDSRLDLVNVKCCFIIAADSDYFLVIFFFFFMCGHFSLGLRTLWELPGRSRLPWNPFSGVGQTGAGCRPCRSAGGVSPRGAGGPWVFLLLGDGG